jgi:predicted DNA-binding ribbon-helix-helix protein
MVKRRIEIAGHNKSVTVEDAFWNGLREIAERRHESLSRLIRNIDAERRHGNLSSACRLYVLRDYQQRTRSSEAAIK